MLGGLCFLVIQLRLGNDHIQRIPPSVTSTTKTLSAEKIVAERLSKSLNHLAAIPVHDGMFFFLFAVHFIYLLFG